MNVQIIAEMACSHEGDVSLAKKIIDGAGKAKANAIQFQIWSLPDMVVPNHPDYRLLTKLELKQSQWEELVKYTRSHYPTMQIIACVYEQKSVDFCKDVVVDAYKIHSADLSNPYLIKYVAATSKRIDLSTGASTLEEIKTAIQWIKETSQSQVWLMYGYQNFPTRSSDVHLRYMMTLKKKFGLPIGYQDHSDAELQTAFTIPAAAVGMGVDIIEKHITHDRKLKGVDHQAALNPDEFVKFVGMIREIEVANGKAERNRFSEDELKYRKYAKKSLVAKHNIPSGTQLTQEDLSYMRAAELGLPPDQAHLLIGRVTRREIDAYQLIRKGDVI